LDNQPQVSPTILSPLLFISHCGMNRWILPVAFLISRKFIIANFKLCKLFIVTSPLSE
jgi:hypothetical protein